MTYKEWEWELRYLLGDLPQKEIDEITSYYREIYGDKKEAGFSDSEIIVEFGTPKECALKMRESDFLAGVDPSDYVELSQNKEDSLQKNSAELQNLQSSVGTNESPLQYTQKEADAPAWAFGKGTATQTGQGGKKDSVSKALISVLMIVATVFVAIWVFVALYVVTLSCAVCAVGGVVGAVYSIINGLFGGFLPWIASAGAYMVIAGVSAIGALYLFKASKFLTKWYWDVFKKTLAKEDNMGAKEENK